MDMSSVTRLELIDSTPCRGCNGETWITEEDQKPRTCPDCDGLGTPGRNVVFWDAYKKVELSLQDDGKTLKVFISGRDNENRSN